jgi:hypothetical protein
MMINNIRDFGNRHFHKLQTIFLNARGPGDDGVLDKFCSDVHPVNANVIAVVRVMKTVVVQRYNLGAIGTLARVHVVAHDA